MENKKDIKNNNEEIEVIIGGDRNLEFTEAKDCITSLRPKDKKKIKKVIVPKNKEKK